ncbi:MAG: hypothetical protein HC880_11125 [Bacteroidia bacterium]|nr:hypothetical protein [Bacteroidia bacterium]
MNIYPNLGTASEIIENILQEYHQRVDAGEEFRKIEDFYAFYYIDKYLTREQKSHTCKDLITEIVNQAKQTRNRLVKEYPKVNPSAQTAIQEKAYPLAYTFYYCVPTAAPVMTNEEILELSYFYDDQYQIDVYGVFQKPQAQMDLNTQLIPFYYFLGLVVYFQHKHEISPPLKQRLQEFKKHPIFGGEYRTMQIEDMLNGSKVWPLFCLPRGKRKVTV